MDAQIFYESHQWQNLMWGRQNSSCWCAQFWLITGLLVCQWLVAWSCLGMSSNWKRKTPSSLNACLASDMVRVRHSRWQGRNCKTSMIERRCCHSFSGFFLESAMTSNQQIGHCGHCGRVKTTYSSELFVVKKNSVLSIEGVPPTALWDCFFCEAMKMKIHQQSLAISVASQRTVAGFSFLIASWNNQSHLSTFSRRSSRSYVLHCAVASRDGIRHQTRIARQDCASSPSCCQSLCLSDGT